jgi:tetratricopeptide (TPR) repeat protein
VVYEEVIKRMNENLNKSQLDSFDELFVGNPVDIERNLSALLPEAGKRADKSVYLQILSQIALAQAMQQKFDIAHQTLDEAERLLEPQYQLAKIRLLLERGRVYHQSDRLDQSLSFFIQSYDLSKLSPEFDFHTVNAAHMVAIVEKHAEGKIEWNKRAINLAEQAKDERCHAWLGPIYNNLAQNYIEAEKYQEALQAFDKCKAHAEERGDQIVIRGALWGMGRALRGLNKLDQALDIQNDLLKEYEKISDQRLLPMELIYVGRGLVYEELAEIYFAKRFGEQSQKYAHLAYADLSKDAWMKKLYPKRIQRLLELGKL